MKPVELVQVGCVTLTLALDSTGGDGQVVTVALVPATVLRGIT
ncbi:hypothetical protein GCM10027044_32660 [Hymenobacter ruber]